MSRPRPAEVAATLPDGPRPFCRLALRILWPSFLMAGVLEGLVFAVVDPSIASGSGAVWLGDSASAVYSVLFLIFWATIATAGALTQLLAAPGPTVR